MRIPSGSTDRIIYFVAVDATDLQTRETGLSGFTVYRSRNGGAATVYTTPTVAEISAGNMPGVYGLTIDEDTTIGGSHDTEEYVLHITHASMDPVTRVLELYRPKATEGQTIDTATGGVEVGTFQTGAITSGAFAAGAINAAAIATDALDAVKFSAAACRKMADHIWRRTLANVAASSDGDTITARSPLNAMRKLVNRVRILTGVLTVYAEDDTTSAFTQNVTTAAGSPISEIDTV